MALFVSLEGILLHCLLMLLPQQLIFEAHLVNRRTTKKNDGETFD